MFKKLLTACAAIALTSSHSVVAQVNPLAAGLHEEVPSVQQTAASMPVATFVGEADGLPLVVQFARQNGSVTGRIIVGNQSFSCAGREQNGSIDGVWGAQASQRIPFQAEIRDGALRLTTNGKTYTLAQHAPDAQPQPKSVGEGFMIGVDTNQPVQPSNPAPATASTLNLSQAQIKGGQFFNTPVLPGWQVHEAATDVAVISPDSKSAYGIIGMKVAPETTPEQFLYSTFKNFGVRDLQILSSQSLKSQQGQPAIDAQVSFTGGDGVKRRGMVRVAVMNNNGLTFAFFQHAATPADRWASDGQTLLTLVSQIRPATQPPAASEYPQPGGNINRYDGRTVDGYDRRVNDRNYDDRTDRRNDSDAWYRN